MQVKLLKDCMGENGPLKKGQIVDHPKADWLLRLGIAHPVDMEAIRVHRDLRKKIAAEFDAAVPEPSVPSRTVMSEIEFVGFAPTAPIEPIVIPAAAAGPQVSENAPPPDHGEESEPE